MIDDRMLKLHEKAEKIVETDIRMKEYIRRKRLRELSVSKK